MPAYQPPGPDGEPRETAWDDLNGRHEPLPGWFIDTMGDVALAVVSARDADMRPYRRKHGLTGGCG